MSFFRVPLRNDLPFYSFRDTFSGVVYTLQLKYNTRMQRWILDLQDPAGNPILAGLVLVTRRSLTAQYGTYGVPPGIFFVVDNTGNDAQPTQFSFGNTHDLIYSDSA